MDALPETTGELLKYSVQIGLTIFSFLAVLFILFVILRRFIHWYFKLDKIEQHLAKLEEMEIALKDIAILLAKRLPK